MAANNDIPLPISFGDDDHDEEQKGDQQEVNRGVSGGTDIMSSFRAQNEFEAPRGMAKQAGSSTLQQTLGGGGDSSGPSFGHKHPLQIITLELDDAPKQKQAAPQLVAVVDAAESKAAEIPKESDVPYTNDIRSYAVKGQSPSQVLSGLTAVLVGYSQDMDIKLDEAKNKIEGVVFVENYYGIKFTINIWSESAEVTRFELTRNGGDALATSKFLGDIKTKFFVDIEETQNVSNQKLSDEVPGFNLISLSVDVGSLDLKELFRQITSDNLLASTAEEEDQITKEELDDVNEILSNNEQESVDELEFLHARLKENGAIGKDIVSHEQLVKTIIAEAMKNKDICVVRGCLLILDQLCYDSKIAAVLVEEYALFENLAALLNKEQMGLIKNYSVRLLAKLSAEDSKKWNMDSSNAANIENLVKQYQAEWKQSILANNGFLNQDMFDSIYSKLAQCK